jgi:hypothetical protein
MRRYWMVVGSVVFLLVGCKGKPVPATTSQPVVAPRAVAPEPAFHDPVPAAVPAAAPRRVHRAPQVVVSRSVTATPEADEQVQQTQDDRLLKEQQEASKKQQEELNQTVQQSIKSTQQMQNEQRIQEAPGPPPAPQGIQDDPSVPLAPPVQPAPQPAPQP